MAETKLEHILTHCIKAEMIAHMKSYPEDFRELIKLALADHQPYSWRASWLLWSCMEKNDKRLRKYTDRIIDTLPHRKDNQLRELMVILRKMELSEASEGRLFDICVDVWQKKGKQPSVRFNAFRLMAKIIRKHPELLQEVDLLTDSYYMDTLSDGVKRSIGRIISGLEMKND